MSTTSSRLFRQRHPRRHREQMRPTRRIMDTQQRKEWRARWRKKNRDKINAAAREFRADHPERVRATQRRASRRRYPWMQEWMAQLKAQPCMDCQQTFSSECMDFDHVPGRGEKKFRITIAELGRREEEVAAELAKCDLVCSNCHRTRTKKRRACPFIRTDAPKVTRGTRSVRSKGRKPPKPRALPAWKRADLTEATSPSRRSMGRKFRPPSLDRG